MCKTRNQFSMKTFPEYFNKMIMHIVLVMAFIVMNLTGIFAQEEYQTSAGTLFITAFLNDKPVKIISKKLLIRLDYETGKVMMKQEISALTSDNDSIQSRLENKKNEYIRFEGKLGIDYINTKSHPPLDFPVEGIIYPQNKHVMGSGHLVHRVEGSSSSCLLSMTFQLSVDEAFPDIQLAGLDNEVYIQVVQSLLARINER